MRKPQATQSPPEWQPTSASVRYRRSYRRGPQLTLNMFAEAQAMQGRMWKPRPFPACLSVRPLGCISSLGVHCPSISDAAVKGKNNSKSDRLFFQSPVLRYFTVYCEYALCTWRENHKLGLWTVCKRMILSAGPNCSGADDAVQKIVSTCIMMIICCTSCREKTAYQFSV